MAMKHVLILGASSDIGIEIIKQLECDDVQVLAHCFQHPEKLVALNRQYCGDIIPMPADLNTEVGTQSLIKQVSEVCDMPDQIVILQAPPLQMKRFKSLTRDDFQQDFHLQTLAAFDVLKYFAPRMAKRGSGHIVFLLSSVTLGLPPSAMAHYTTGKYALMGLMRAVAAEYGHKGLKVNAVSPSMMETSFLHHVPDKLVELHAEKHPLGRNASTKDVAPVVAFLLSEGAEYMNGANLPISGGEVI
ncbi:SDR family oxidoreductase [Vibrio sp. Of7-15]|uniref:SDR family NAD(P)-dependent oxidoreductase n=1 Tax=Vibrio sp. Of7-15 TaxID=2724879 RepID=UPI001EF3BADD|nr:SDR family oxidoreductase [Vibrio sp. Of7-15]MCG7499643.1 SDR family oxidoreductase [Vibrio sp. Of7-15]